MNFLFVDQLCSYELGKGIRGLKHVTAYDSYLIKTSTGKPALMSCIVGEALGQLCSWYIIKALDAKFRSVAGLVSEVIIYNHAYVGDTIELEVSIEHLDEQAVNWHGQAKVQGQTILVIKSSVGPCLPMTEFNDPKEVLQQLKMIDRPIEFMPNMQEGQALIPDSIKYQPELTSYDKILLWEQGKKVVAQKNISIIAPYFVDHFPLKPVLPVSLLLETKLQLAQTFIEDLLGHEKAQNFYTSSVRHIKIRDFILPGQSVITTLTVKECNEQQIILSFQSTVNEKRVCMAEAVFVKLEK